MCATMKHMGNSSDNPISTPKDGRHQQPPDRESREQKLRKIAKRVKDGTYQVDTDAVAERVLRQHLLPDKDTDQH